MVLAHVDVFVQAFGAVAAATAAVAGIYARGHAKAAQGEARRGRIIGESVEDAVNHRHKHDGTPPRLYDIALENRTRLNENEVAHALLIDSIRRLEGAVERHIEWEEDEKYSEIERLLRGDDR